MEAVWVKYPFHFIQVVTAEVVNHLFTPGMWTAEIAEERVSVHLAALLSPVHMVAG